MSPPPYIVGVDFKTHEPNVQSYIHSNIHTSIQVKRCTLRLMEIQLIGIFSSVI